MEEDEGRKTEGGWPPEGNGGMPEAAFAEAGEAISEAGEVGATRAPGGEEAEGEEAPAPEPEAEAAPEGQDGPEGPEAGRKPAPRTFTQEEVNAIISKRVGETKERAFKEGRDAALAEMREKWGVGSDDELDALFGDGQRYPSLEEEYGSARRDLADLRGENALLRAGIPAERWDDVRAIVAYGGSDLCDESISELLETHPEWAPKAKGPTAPEPAGYGTPERPIVARRVEGIGRERGDAKGESQTEREYEDAMRFMGL